MICLPPAEADTGSKRITYGLGGRNSSVGSAWARGPQRRGFDPPLGKFSGRGDFSLGVNMGSNSIPQKLFRMRGLVCAHMHFIARTQKILTGECNKNTPSTHHPRRRNVTTLMVGLKKTVTYANISPKSGEPQRYSWGTQKKKKKKKSLWISQALQTLLLLSRLTPQQHTSVSQTTVHAFTLR